MNKANSIFTKTRFGLDVRVWLTMFIAFVISVIVLSFKMATNVECVDFNISMSSGKTTDQRKSYYINETIFFKVNVAGNVQWDFGDNSPVKEGANATHFFSKAKDYQVTATVNGKCVQVTDINIRQFEIPKPQTDSGAIIANSIVGPDAPPSGIAVTYSCSIQASSYEWSIDNSPNFKIQNTNIATFNFPTPGNKTILLKLDNNPLKTVKKTIVVVADNNQNAAPIIVPPVVIPKKQPPPAAAQPAALPPAATQPAAQPVAPLKKTLIIPDEEFKNMFDQVVNGTMDAQSFNDYLCNGPSTKVFTSDGGLETVGSFCGKIHGNKKYRINTVKIDRDSKNCVTDMHIDYKKKGGFL
jgi:hypothetical protein